MKTLLICDDDKQVLLLTKLILTRSGWNVITSTDCNNIIDKVRQNNPSVILMDNEIPDEGGVSATKRVKKDCFSKNIPVVLFTSSDNITGLAKEAGAEFYLEKNAIHKLEEVVLKAYDMSRQLVMV